MAFELVYTSVPQGIRPGSSGFCTVAYTNGLAANLILQLEGMSAYKAYFPHYDENANNNPVSYSHYIYSNSGGRHHILSRVCFYGLDYTKRSNKLAHHLVVSQQEANASDGGPASVFRQDGLFFTEWTGGPELFPKQKAIGPADEPLRTAQTWQEYTGDAGWAGVLAEAYLKSPAKPVFIIFDPLRHTDTLSLVSEAMMLLPREARWKVSFNTYLTTLPAGLQCSWRFCVPNSDPLKEARRVPGTVVIDLTRPMDAAPDGKLVQVARTGQLPQEKAAPVLDIPASARQDRPQEKSKSLKLTIPSGKKKLTPIPIPPPPPPPGKAKRGSVSKKNKIILLGGIAAILLVLLAVGSVFGIAYYKSGSASRHEMPDRDREDILDRRAENSERKSAAEPKKKAEVSDEKKTEAPAAKKADAPAAKKAETPAAKKAGTPADKKSAPKQPEKTASVSDPTKYFWYQNELKSLLKKDDLWTSEAILDPRKKLSVSSVTMNVKWVDDTKEETCKLSDGVFAIERMVTSLSGVEEKTTLFSARVKIEGGKLVFTVTEDKHKNAGIEWRSLTLSDKRVIHCAFVPNKTLVDPKDAKVTVTISGLKVDCPLTEEDGKIPDVQKKYRIVRLKDGKKTIYEISLTDGTGTIKTAASLTPDQKKTYNARAKFEKKFASYSRNKDFKGYNKKKDLKIKDDFFKVENLKDFTCQEIKNNLDKLNKELAEDFEKLYGPEQAGKKYELAADFKDRLAKEAGEKAKKDLKALKNKKIPVTAELGYKNGGKWIKVKEIKDVTIND